MGSRLDYCNSLLAGTSVLNLSRLQLVQNTLARVAAQTPRYCRITPVLIDLHWLPIRQRIEFRMATTAFKVLHYQQPSYLAEILPRYTSSRSLRSSASTTISVPLDVKERCFFSCFKGFWVVNFENIINSVLAGWRHVMTSRHEITILT